MPTTGGMISRFQLPTCAHLRLADGGHPRRTRATHRSWPRPAKRPVATMGADITAAPS